MEKIDNVNITRQHGILQIEITRPPEKRKLVILSILSLEFFIGGFFWQPLWLALLLSVGALMWLILKPKETTWKFNRRINSVSRNKKVYHGWLSNCVVINKTSHFQLEIIIDQKSLLLHKSPRRDELMMIVDQISTYYLMKDTQAK